jgi:hypothetical protein
MMLMAPLFFFLLCLLDVCHGRGGKVKERKCIGSVVVGLDRLDFVSEASLDLYALRSKYSVKYVYIHED